MLLERKGALSFSDPPFTLTGQPDRIDRDADGRLMLYDYKTGTLPSAKQITFYNKQLSLLAVMARDDAFGLGPGTVAEACFVGLGSKFDTRQVPAEAADIADHHAKLLTLLTAYASPDQGFTAMRAVEQEDRTGDYDALSRRGEWETTDDAVLQRVGDDG